MTNDLIPFEEQFPLAKIDPDSLQEIIHQNLDGEGIDRFDLEQIEVGSGGMPGFKLKRGDQVDSAKSIDAIIIHQHPYRTFYKVGITEGGSGTPPDCSSADGQTGNGDIGDGSGPGVRQCASCPKNAWGTDPKGARGKACKEYKAVYLYRSGKKGMFPSLLKVPPTSLGALRGYSIYLTEEGINRSAAIHRFSTRKASNKDGTDYSEIQVQLVRKMTEEEAGRVLHSLESMKGLISATRTPIPF